jgi:hypothetical protein
VKKKGFCEDHAHVGVPEKQEWSTCCPAGGSFSPTPSPNSDPPKTPSSTPVPPPATPPKPKYVSWLATFPRDADTRHSLLGSIAADLAAATRARSLALSGDAAEAGCISECKSPQPHSASFVSRGEAAPSLDVWLTVHRHPPPGGLLLGLPAEASAATVRSAERVVRFLEREKVSMHIALRMAQQAGYRWRGEKPDSNAGALLSDGVCTMEDLATIMGFQRTTKSCISLLMLKLLL